MIQVITDGTKPGFNFNGSTNPFLQFFTGWRWTKFGIFTRFVMAPPQGDWFNLAAGFVPTYHKTVDEVKNFSFMLTVRCVLTVSIELQLRFGVRDTEAVARHIKSIMDDMETRGVIPQIHDQTGNQGLAEAINKIADSTPPKDKGKLN